MGANCVISTGIGCWYAFKGCDAERTKNSLAFGPPKPFYKVDENGKLVYTVAALQESNLYCKALRNSEVHWLSTKTGNKIPMVWLFKDEFCERESNPFQPVQPMVILHCHGRSIDIGASMATYYQLAWALQVEVCGIEYAGYGVASGRPSIENACADAEAAYQYLLSLGIPSERIIVYGESIGSGPATELASKKPVGGLILHAPFLSAIKVFDCKPPHCCLPSNIWGSFDFYRNEEKIPKLHCPLFVLHGKKDNIVPFKHGWELHNSCPQEHQWRGHFPSKAGHSDIIEADFEAYFTRINEFVEHVQSKADAMAQRETGTMPVENAKAETPSTNPMSKPLTATEVSPMDSFSSTNSKVADAKVLATYEPYREEIYTTLLDRRKIPAHKRREAERIARQIRKERRFHQRN